MYATVLGKKNETDTVGKRFVENKIKSLCDTSRAQYSYSNSIKRTKEKESAEAMQLSRSLLDEAETLLKREKNYSTPDLENYYRSTKDAQKYDN